MSAANENVAKLIKFAIRPGRFCKNGMKNRFYG